MLLLSSASGALKLRTVADISNSRNVEEDTPGFLDTLLAPLPGSQDTKVMILGVTGMLFFVFLVVIVVSVRSSRKEDGLLAVLEPNSETGGDSLELLIAPLDDEGPLMAIDTEAEDLVVEFPSTPTETVESELSLSESLEAKSESGEGNSRLDRRMKRKQQREVNEMVQAMNKSLPPLSTVIDPSTESAPLPSTPVLPLPAALDGAPPLLPALDGTLPPLPGLPLPMIAPPQRDVTCMECQAKFTVKDMTLTRVQCPICSAKVQL